MPAYTYRCQHCSHTENIVQGFNEAFAPPCSACGGLTERIITQAPTVVSPTPEPTPAAEPEHQCSPTCVLHRRSPAL